MSGQTVGWIGLAVSFALTSRDLKIARAMSESPFGLGQDYQLLGALLFLAVAIWLLGGEGMAAAGCGRARTLWRVPGARPLPSPAEACPARVTRFRVRLRDK